MAQMIYYSKSVQIWWQRLIFHNSSSFIELFILQPLFHIYDNISMLWKYWFVSHKHGLLFCCHCNFTFTLSVSEMRTKDLVHRHIYASFTVSVSFCRMTVFFFFFFCLWNFTAPAASLYHVLWSSLKKILKNIYISLKFCNIYLFTFKNWIVNYITYNIY